MNKPSKLNVILFLLFILLFLTPGLYSASVLLEEEAHYTPDYSMQSLQAILAQPQLSKVEYLHLFYQTGLAPQAIDEILEHSGTSQAAVNKIISIQQRFFAPVEVSCRYNSQVSKEEQIPAPAVSASVFAPYHDSYILITFASHTAFWRNGHAALIVDAENSQTLEALVLGSNTTYQPVSKWGRYPAFILLRLKQLTPELAASIVSTAQERLHDIPYRLTAGVFSRSLPAEGPFSGTQCAHLVNSAFSLNGYNLDSDGGSVVTPKDLLESKQLEIVQIYGCDPNLFTDRVFQ